MGAGIQRWWRSYGHECEAWSMRDIVYRFTATDGTTMTLYKDGSRSYTYYGFSARLQLWG